MEMIKIVELTGFVYTSGQGGVPVYMNDFANVDKAAFIGVSGLGAGSLATSGQVVSIGLQSASVFGTSTIYPTTNEVVLQLFQSSAGTLTELASGTVGFTVNLIVSGY